MGYSLFLQFKLKRLGSTSKDFSNILSLIHHLEKLMINGFIIFLIFLVIQMCYCNQGQNINPKSDINLTITTAATPTTKAKVPGKILFGIVGTNVDHITCIQIHTQKSKSMKT